MIKHYKSPQSFFLMWVNLEKKNQNMLARTTEKKQFPDLMILFFDFDFLRQEGFFNIKA